MINRLFFCILTIALCASAPAAAAEKSVLDAVVAALTTGYASIEDLQADFSQSSYIASLKREEKGAGELLLRKKGELSQFRFNYTKPKQQIISNGTTVWYYLPDNRQVIQTDTARLFSGGNSIALSYLTGLGQVANDFDLRLLTESPDKKGNYQLELIPKKQNPAVAKLHLAVPAAAVETAGNAPPAVPFFPIASSVLFDQMGNRTTIEYSRIRLNKGLAAGRFSFKPPAGVEVIKQ